MHDSVSLSDSILSLQHTLFQCLYLDSSLGRVCQSLSPFLTFSLRLSQFLQSSWFFIC